MQRHRRDQASRAERLSVVPPTPDRPANADVLLTAVGRGDEAAFVQLYNLVAPRVYGLVKRVLRDPAQAEEVAQETLVEIWRTAARFRAGRGSATAWVFTIAHRRAVDRVRSEQSATRREEQAATWAEHRPYDQVADEVHDRLERQQVRRCLDGLTDLQRESITLAYYQGCTYPEVARMLDVSLPTIKSRMRDGLIRLRDCLGVEVRP
ncbi:RNA polymerase sigma-70 factor, ECF subfamily [Asanoa hainanensis]|uniref:RNA polymerase sigma-70 factor, ECF subfamily n=1 Tax=Asanoa hainanensis TaxID=560556 RepID=A0A239N5Q7_9ACTN|nr:ECF RNA polymerase sigma factor SigK [Asanoa hainanensis]SNT50266.1 RNA polymerase sigma-70 factor, ECF subfamily [Asanoa hainanensis]